MPSGGSHFKYDKNFRALLEANIEAGVRPRDIARDMKITKSLLCQMRSHYEAFGTMSPNPLGIQGRPRKVHQKVEEDIIDFLEEYPIAQQDEVYLIPGRVRAKLLGTPRSIPLNDSLLLSYAIY